MRQVVVMQALHIQQYFDVCLFQVSITLFVVETVGHVCPAATLVVNFQKSRAKPNTAILLSGLQAKSRQG